MELDPELYPVTLDLDTKEVVRPNGMRVRVYPMLWKLLLFMNAHANEVLPPERILTGAWSKESWDDPNILSSHVSHLRKKYGIDVIESIKGYGYKLIKGSVAPLTTGVGETVPVHAEENYVTRAELRQVLEKMSDMFEALAGGLK